MQKLYDIEMKTYEKKLQRTYQYYTLRIYTKDITRDLCGEVHYKICTRAWLWPNYKKYVLYVLH